MRQPDAGAAQPRAQGAPSRQASPEEGGPQGKAPVLGIDKVGPPPSPPDSKWSRNKTQGEAPPENPTYRPSA